MPSEEAVEVSGMKACSRCIRGVSRWVHFRRAEVFVEALEGAGIEAGPRHLRIGCFAVWRLHGCAAAARARAGGQRTARRPLGDAHFQDRKEPNEFAGVALPAGLV
jgi:hypothetical protein